MNANEKTCGRCKGKGAYFTKIRNDSQLVEHYVTCDMPGCHNGIVDLKENKLSFMGEPRIVIGHDGTKFSV